MSDFAAALASLQRTAERAAVAVAVTDAEKKTKKRVNNTEDIILENRGDDNSHSGQKRRRRSNHHHYRPPDFSQLTVRVSFLCIGAQKGGTNWLHQMLCKCPALSLPKQKEIHFWDWHRKKQLGWYSKQFPRLGGKNVMFGEVTPCYMTLGERDIREIYALFPSARIIFLARNLVDRAWSALLMELRNSMCGMEAGQFQADATINQDMKSRQFKKMEQEADPDLYKDDYFLERLEHSTHSTRSDYAGGLKRWLEYFPKEQLLILDYADIEQNPTKILRQTLEHIGVKEVGAFVASLREEDLAERVNVATGQTLNRTIRPSLRNKMEKNLKGKAKAFNDLLGDLGYDWSLNAYD